MLVSTQPGEPDLPDPRRGSGFFVCVTWDSAEPMTCWLYILESEVNGRYYVGTSSDPDRRLRHHNTTTRGFTARYRPWRLVFRQPFPSCADAEAADQQVKAWKSRKMTRYVIDGTIDLSSR